MTAMRLETQLLEHIGRLRSRALRIGFAALALSAVSVLFDPTQFFRSYLFGYLFWIGVTLGSLAILMIHHLVGGKWGYVTRRTLEASTRVLPLMAVLFIPILFGLSELYSWARPEVVAQDALLQHKSPYLNVPFFMLRVAGYFAVWLLLTRTLNRWSQEQDDTANAHLVQKFENLSGPGLVLYGGTMTFAAFDWAMSLDPHWFSTMFGVIFMVGQVLTAFAFIIISVNLLSSYKPLSEVLTVDHFHDLGKLMMAFVMLWAYMSFSQFLIIWSGNLAEEVTWYVQRQDGDWPWVAIALIVGHFILPFALLLSQHTKRNKRLLSMVAGLILCMRLIDLTWQIGPALHPADTPLAALPAVFGLHLLDIGFFLGMGGLWLNMFLNQLTQRPLLPLHDPDHEAASPALEHAEMAQR